LRLRLGIGTAVAASALAVASAAQAAVTIGQLAPGDPSTCFNTSPQDLIQPTVISGNPYVVPSIGGVTAWRVTSWSHKAGGGTGLMLAFKAYRHVSGSQYTAIGHDGPRSISAGTINTFSGLSIPVRSGDAIGLHKPGGGTGCVFPVPGEQYLFRGGDLADGQSGDFLTGGGERVNVVAVVAPDNTFTRGTVRRNKNKGTATMTLNLPNPGELAGSGGGAKVAEGATASKAVPAGQATLVIRAKGKKKAKLNEAGKVKVKPKITYTPTGGDPSTQTLKLKLRKRL
jgi:hypothetical protein